MKLFFYILRLFLKLTAGVLMLAVFMFVLSDLVDKYSRLFERYNATSTDIFYYYLYEIPFQAIQILPFAALIGSIGTMMMLNRTGEIIAIRAAGLGPFRILKPILAGGICFTILTLAISQSVIPKFSIKRNHLLETLKGRKVQSLSENRWVKKGDWVYTFSDYNLSTKTLSGVKAFRFGGSSISLKEVWRADKAVYDSKKERWVVKEKHNVKFLNVKKVKSKSSGTQVLKLPYEPMNLFKDERNPIEFSYLELVSKIRNMKKTGAQFRRFEVSLHVKLGYCFAALLLSVMGLKFGFTFERSSAVMKSLLMSISFGVGYWFVLSSVRAMVLSSSSPTWIAGWAANFFILVVIYFETRKLGRI
jgi:lipopolysaccharide export system permease protein